MIANVRERTAVVDTIYGDYQSLTRGRVPQDYGFCRMVRVGGLGSGVGSRESGVGGRGSGVGGRESGVGGLGSGVGSRESGVGGRGSGVDGGGQLEI